MRRVGHRDSVPVSIALLAVWFCACSLDLAKLEGAATEALDGGSESAQPRPAEPRPADDAEVVAPEPDMGEGIATGPPFEPPVPPAGVTCGLVGLPCCRPDNACDVGACLRGECSAYAGAYAERLGCGDNTCIDRDPYSAGCACPLGFSAISMLAVRAPCDDGAAAQKTLSVCQASRTDAAAWGGLWLSGSGPLCASGCRIENPYTNDCSCPDGMVQVTSAVELADEGCAGDGATLGVCIRAGLMSARFSGAYVLAAGGGNGCPSPNPHTGTCSCPAGALDQHIAIGDGVTLGLCSM